MHDNQVRSEKITISVIIITATSSITISINLYPELHPVTPPCYHHHQGFPWPEPPPCQRGAFRELSSKSLRYTEKADTEIYIKGNIAVQITLNIAKW